MQDNRTARVRRRELVLVTVGRIHLPVLEVPWRDDCLTALRSRRGLVTAPGYHKGRRSPTAGKRFPPTPPTPQDALAILNAFPIHTKVGRRNRALTVVLWRAGLRINEALDLLPGDIDLANHTITVRSGKGGKRRLVGIDPSAARELLEWLDERAWLGVRPHEPVFCSMRHDRLGGRMYASTFREALAGAAGRAGVDKRVAPHQLRHAMAVELAREGVAIPLLSRQLGHSNIATTSTYLQGISPVEVINTMAARSWPGSPA